MLGRDPSQQLYGSGETNLGNNSCSLRKTIQKDEENGQPEEFSKWRESYDQIEVRSTPIQSSKNKEQVYKYSGLVEAIHRVGNASYRIQLLPWTETSPVVYVNNLKRNYLDQEDTKHKEVIRPHVTKKNFTMEKVGETSRKKM